MYDDHESTLIEPLVILPSQVCVDARGAHDTSGAIALMRAVLEEAAWCIVRGRRRRHPETLRLAAEASDWVRCDGRESVFAFATICDVLGLDVDATRAKLLDDARPPLAGRRPPWRSATRRGVDQLVRRAPIGLRSDTGTSDRIRWCATSR